ncbi:hypothetical protein E3P99_01979 [Wallemia hederae]|uniref:GATA-type domain-containing protein n=1 Tax=Wallemia hederae TaxID=1540922 RepID=A0A4T0FQ11_9BASI|nr:hypothetical protein E3P99_01979 [Wallemia hederae]
MAGRPSKKQRIVKVLDANVVYTILPSSHTFMARTSSSVEVEVVQNNYGSFGRCNLRDCLTQACITSPELLDDYTLHAMNAYETEKLAAAGVDTQPVFAIEGSVKKCLADPKKLVIGNLEAGDPFDDDSDVLKVVLRFQRIESESKPHIPKASTSKVGRPPGSRKRAPSTPPSRKASSSHVKKEKAEKKSEKIPEICVICGTTDTATWRYVGEASSERGRARACNSCGLYWKKNNSVRPETLWKGEEEKNKELNKGTKSRRKLSTHRNENVNTGDGSPVRRSFSVSQSSQTPTQTRRSPQPSHSGRPRGVLGDLNANKVAKRQEITNSLKAPPRKEAEPGFKIPAGPFTSPPRKTAYNNEYLQDILNSSPGTMLKHVFSEADAEPKDSPEYNSFDDVSSFAVNPSAKNPSPLKFSVSSEAEEEDDDTTIMVDTGETTGKSGNATTPFDFNNLPPSSPPDTSDFVSPVDNKNKNSFLFQLPGFAKSSSKEGEDDDEIDELASSPPDSARTSKYQNLDELFKLIGKKGDGESPFIVDSPPEEPYPV